MRNLVLALHSTRRFVIDAVNSLEKLLVSIFTWISSYNIFRSHTFYLQYSVGSPILTLLPLKYCSALINMLQKVARKKKELVTIRFWLHYQWNNHLRSIRFKWLTLECSFRLIWYPTLQISLKICILKLKTWVFRINPLHITMKINRQNH